MKWLGLASLLFLASGWSALPASAGDSCISSACHATLGQAKVVHAPVADGCGDCHQPTGKEHPGGKGAFTLAARGADLCLGCHDDPRRGQKVPHAPAANGKCTACHDPHGSAGKGLLKKEGADLCVGCHKDPVAGRPFVHTPVKAGECTACHDPHRGEARALLIATGAALCSRCHDWKKTEYRQHGPVAGGNCRLCHEAHAGQSPGNLRLAGGEVCYPCHRGVEKQIKSSAFQHGPVGEGDCAACHVPHGNGDRPYLIAPFPDEFYVAFAEEDFGLCFTCHDRNLALYQRTSAATGFRNGDRNLHFLHVNRSDKGRVCKVCHGIHGADQAKLIKSASPGFGSWEIPIQMTFTKSGATCYVGCHNPKTYDRLRPVRNR